jgi:hypothetical protein
MTSQSEGQLVGQQEPRILHSPRKLYGADKFTSAGSEVIDLAASAGLFLDPWQCIVLDHGLDERKIDGRVAAREVGVVVSRQNGKGSILEALELADLFLLDSELTIHSAHWAPTSSEALLRLETLIEATPEIDKLFTKYQGKIWHANGKEGVELKRGGKRRRVKFQTRTRSGGRGLTGDRVVIDEAMLYDADMDAALRPTLSADLDAPSGRQMWLLGSAGEQTSIIFGKMRQRALKGEDPTLCFAEWSIDACNAFCRPDCADHDPVDESLGRDKLMLSYAKSNPGLGIRISVEACESERFSMDKDKFARERLGVGEWPIEGDAWAIVPKSTWIKRECKELFPPRKPLAFAIDTPLDRRWSCIAVCGSVGGNMVAGEITGNEDGDDFRPGTQWVVPRAIEIAKANPGCAFVIDKGTQAIGYIDELEAAGVELLLPQAREYAEACGFLIDAINGVGSEPKFVHNGQKALDAAVAGVSQRVLQDLWAWDKRNPTVHISPLVAVTLAHWGHKKLVTRPKPRPMAAWA